MAVIAAALATLLLLAGSGGASDVDTDVTLRSGNATIVLSVNGSVVALSDGDWSLIDDREGAGIAVSFRALVPLSGATPPATDPPRRRFNYADGLLQPHLPEMNRSSDGVTFLWRNVHSTHGGEHVGLDMAFGVHARGGAFVFSATVRNGCNETVENVHWPHFGDVAPPSGAATFQTFSAGYSDPEVMQMWPTFAQGKGYFGTDFPTQLVGGGQDNGGATPTANYVLLHTPASRDPATGRLAGGRGAVLHLADAPGDALFEKSGVIGWMTQLRPGYVRSELSAVPPRGTAVGGHAVCTPFAAVHLPYVQPGETRDMSPIALSFFRGGWTSGVDVYARWLRGWLEMPPLPAWMRSPHSWQQIQLNDPEDKEGVTYKQLADVGRQAAAFGVRAIQVTGWNIGGQDQDTPSHSTDPRLGTADELRASIRDAQGVGVKIILFTKFLWGDQATDWYKKELVADAVKDPFGDPYRGPAYQYSTASMYMDIDTKRLVPMCFLSPNYQRVVAGEFEKELALGADGILQDECQHHVAHACFDESHGHRAGASAYREDRALIKNLSRLAAAHRGDDQFLFAGESPYDWEFDTYHAGYFRSFNPNHVPVKRYTLPDRPILTAVVGWDDRNMINQCLLYRYIVSYEPYNFHGRLDAIPKTMAYGARMDALRTEARRWLWDGDFLYERGALVVADPPSGFASVRYSVFRAANATGDAGCAFVVANYDSSGSVTAHVTPDGECAGSLAAGASFRLVDGGGVWQPCGRGAGGSSCAVALPPLSAAVVAPAIAGGS